MTQISKWFSLCLVAMLAFTVSGFAQEDKTNEEDPVVVYDPDDVDGTRGFSKSKIVLGGSGTFGVANNALFYEFSPFVGYRIVDRWVAGVGFNLSQQSQKFAEPQYTDITRQTFSGARVLTRYMLFHVGDPAGIYGLAEFQYNRIKQVRRINNEIIDEIKLDPKASMLFGLGYSSNYYQGFGYNVEVSYDVLHKDGESFSIWPIQYRVGFTWGF